MVAFSPLKNSRSRSTSGKMPAHVGAGVPATLNMSRGLSPRGYDFAEAERVRYDTYGQRTVLAADGVTTRSASSYGNQRGFTGYYLDAETGLYYARSRMYSAGLGRFMGRDPMRLTRFDGPSSGDGYYDGMNLYMGYFVPGMLDPDGMAVCHVFVYLPKDRTKAGDMFVYNDKGVLRCYFPVRGDGSGGGPLDHNGDTPTGTYKGKVIPANPGGGANGPYGNNERVALEPQSGQAQEAQDAGRSGLQIHGGRQDRAQGKTGTTYDPESGDPKKGQKFKCPMGTHGCLRTYEPNQAALIKCMKECDNCDSWEIHVIEGNAPGNMKSQPKS